MLCYLTVSMDRRIPEPAVEEINNTAAARNRAMAMYRVRFCFHADLDSERAFCTLKWLSRLPSLGLRGDLSLSVRLECLKVGVKPSADCLGLSCIAVEL